MDAKNPIPAKVAVSIGEAISLMFSLPANSKVINTISTTSFQKLVHGFKTKKSPKQPHVVTLL